MFSWLSFCSYTFVTAITPGPINIASMSNASKYGIRKSYLFNLGEWVACSIAMVLCAVFCNVLATVIPIVKKPMLVLAGAYMFFLAYKIFTGTNAIDEKEMKSGFISGFALEMISPQTYIYGIVSVQTCILPYFENDYPKLIIMGLILAFNASVLTLCWALFGSIFRIIFVKYSKIVNLSFAILIAYFAIKTLLLVFE